MANEERFDEKVGMLVDGDWCSIADMIKAVRHARASQEPRPEGKCRICGGDPEKCGHFQGYSAAQPRPASGELRKRAKQAWKDWRPSRYDGHDLLAYGIDLPFADKMDSEVVEFAAAFAASERGQDNLLGIIAMVRDNGTESDSDGNIVARFTCAEWEHLCSVLPAPPAAKKEE